jgi:conjugal transfer pilus assembly protein TraE
MGCGMTVTCGLLGWHVAKQGGDAASSELKESWGLYLAELLGNVTPTNADFIGKAIAPLLSTELYRSVMDALSEQVNALKID